LIRTWQVRKVGAGRLWLCLVCVVSTVALSITPVILAGAARPPSNAPLGFWNSYAYITDWGPTFPAHKPPGGPFPNPTTITSYDPTTGAFSGTDNAWSIGLEKITGTLYPDGAVTYTIVDPGEVMNGKGTITFNVDRTTAIWRGTWSNSIGEIGTDYGEWKGFVLTGKVEADPCGAHETECSVPPTPASGVTIAATGAYHASATTDSQGDYSMTLNAGTWTITPTMDDFTFDPPSRSIHLETDTTDVDFTLLSSPYSIDWQMPSRVKESMDVSSDGGLPPASYVYPDMWSAKLYLTEGGTRVTSCPSGSVWKWHVTALHTVGNRKPTITEPKDGCSTSFETTQLGTYRVVAQKYKRTPKGLVKDGPAVATPDVVLNDLLIVGLGDSNGSGEGYPPFYFDQCHRGIASYQYQAAQMLDKLLEGHTSITFVSASCSGAKIQNLISLSYDGFPPGNSLEPQVGAVRALIADSRGQPPRKVDAAFVSVGVNNIAFGPVMRYCIDVHLSITTCSNQHVAPVYNADGLISGFKHTMSPRALTLSNWVANLTADLPRLYGTLGPVLADLVGPEDTFITQYPTFAYADTKGNICSMFGNGDTQPGRSIFTKATWKWLMDVNLALNAQVAATRSLGWRVVPVAPDYFLGHGYCATDSWFVTITSSIINLNKDGAFHPTEDGAAVTAKLVADDSCAWLVGKAECGQHILPVAGPATG